ncbi:MAG: hypothetical protein JWO82_2185 [Akkermansiaceae bacterium]|nr:hypothetical protein [Akkermansiaceae bacterium]
MRNTYIWNLDGGEEICSSEHMKRTAGRQGISGRRGGVFGPGAGVSKVSGRSRCEGCVAPGARWQVAVAKGCRRGAGGSAVAGEVFRWTVREITLSSYHAALTWGVG